MIRALLMTGFLFSCLAGAAHAQTVHLRCEMPWWNMEWNAVALGPIAQSFDANSDYLDFVELLMSEGPSNSSGVTLAVVLHAGGLEGEVVATSSPAILPDGFDGSVRFPLDRPVRLSPGATYTFELIRTSEQGYAMIRGSNDDPCGSTRGWIEGLARDYVDLWFQVGQTRQVATRVAAFGQVKARFR